jgi:hypothetical protein
MRLAATALLTTALLCTTSALAFGIPSPSNSTVPPCLVVCPAGDAEFTVVVRDVANNPVVGCDVMLDFSGCPSFHVCPDCCQDVIIDRQNHRATMISDANGTARFRLKMGGVCGGAMVLVLACNVLLKQVPMASFDQDGNLEVDASDLLRVESLIGSHDPGADFNCDGTVTWEDVYWLYYLHGGQTCAGITPARLPSWGSLKVIYR